MGCEKPMLNELMGLTSSMPAPVQTAFFKTLGSLLGGLTAIPAGWTKRRVQAYEDVTNARSAVAAIMAKGVAENALADPLIMQAAAEIYLPNEIRKSRNKVQIAQLAAEEINDLQTQAQEASPPNEDWMNVFTRLAEDASSEDVQQLFARILAGEIVRPGSYSRATLRALSELDKPVADDFTQMWSRSVGREVDYTPEFHGGEWYVRWKILAECGLMLAQKSAVSIPSDASIQGGGVWAPIKHGGYTLTLPFSKGDRPLWEHIPFTRVGRELGSILPTPNYRENIENVGRSLAAQLQKKVTLQFCNDPPEIL